MSWNINQLRIFSGTTWLAVKRFEATIFKEKYKGEDISIILTDILFDFYTVVISSEAYILNVDK